MRFTRWKTSLAFASVALALGASGCPFLPGSRTPTTPTTTTTTPSDPGSGSSGGSNTPPPADAPTVSNSALALSSASSTSVTLSWNEAEDGETPKANLEYQVVWSVLNNIDTATNAQANGTVAVSWASASSLIWSSATTSTSITGLAYGTAYYFNVLVRDADHNVVAYTSASQATLAGPSTPVIASPATSPYYSNSGSLTLSGSCSNGYTVYVTGDSTQSQACNAGGFTFTVSKTNDGVYALTVTQSDGSVTSSPASVVWVKDTAAPASPGLMAPSVTPYASGGSSLTLTVSCEVGRTVTLAISGSSDVSQTCGSGATSAFALTQSVDGTYTYSVTQSDLAGNVSDPLTFVWVVDSTKPATPTVTAPASNPYYSNTDSLTISGACTGTHTVQLGGDVSASDVTTPAGSLTTTCSGGLYSFTIAKTGLTAGTTYNFTIEQFYTVNNGGGDIVDYYSAPNMVQWVRDTTKPDPIALLSPDSNSTVSSSGAFQIAGACEPFSTVIVTPSSGSPVTLSCVNQGFNATFTQPSDGSFTYTIEQKDRAGNTSDPVSVVWNKDSSLPASPVITSPLANPLYATSSSLTLSGTCTTGLVVTLTGTQTVNSTTTAITTQTTTCANSSFLFSFTPSNVNYAVYNFSIYQTQGGLNSGPAVLKWLRDVIEVNTTILTKPSDPNVSREAQFTFEANKTYSTFQCRLKTNGVWGSYGSCSSPKTYTLSDNVSYEFNVKATDSVGNEDPSPSTYSWVQNAYKTVALYKFGDGAENFDSSSYNVSGSGDLNFRNTSDVAGMFGDGQGFAATNLNGTVESMIAPHAAAHTSLRDFLTVAFYFKAGSFSNNKVIPIIQKGGNGTNLAWFVGVIKLGSNYYVVFRASTDGVNWLTQVRSTSLVFSSTTYKHVAVTFNKGAVSFYLDGVAKGGASVGTVGSTRLYESTAPMTIGSAVNGESRLYNNAAVDEVSVSNVVRWMGPFTPGEPTAD